jgi:non-specific serine/threonine protein kinase
MTSPPEQIGPYLLLGFLGAGGMGEVHLARDSRLDRDVALKMLPNAFAKDPGRMARFRSEALAIAAINHPNIATVYGFEESPEGRPLLVLEYVPGETLAHTLERGPMTLNEALRVCVQVAEAIEAAHARDVIHRDLKPTNVMLGASGVVKVLDFGLAKTTHSTVSEPVATSAPSQEGDTVLGEDSGRTTLVAESDDSSGTPGYMSPEQVRGEPQDGRSDLFAFGCVLYECLSGRRAFDGLTNAEAKAAVLSQTPAWSALPENVPARLRRLMERCVEKDPSRRPASMREVRYEIEEVLGIRRASALRAGEATAIPNSLPLQPTSFVGRERAIEACRELHRQARLLTITGIGGAGKTRLALRLAEGLLADFPDGVWFVDLAPITDPERLPQAVASSMGVQEESDRPLAETLARHLANRRALLLVDNCEHLLDGCVTLLASLLEAAAELRVIATSREALGIRGEQTYSIPPLSVPATDATAGDSESVHLFMERAALAQKGFVFDAESAPIVAEICRRLDGIPLAIELAAARVRMLSLTQIRDRLHDRFRLLAGGASTTLPRHQRLRAVIEWSYEHVAADEQHLLRSLSVFACGWTLDAAAAVCAPERDEFEVLDSLTRLEDKSLLIVERAENREFRYRFLETVRQYAQELLSEAGERDARRRLHRDWFLAFAERAASKIIGPEQAIWLGRMERDRDNLRAALDACLEPGQDVSLAVLMAVAQQWMWILHASFREGHERMEAVLTRAGGLPASVPLANLHHGAGNMCFRLDDLEAARAHYEDALAIRESIGDTAGMAGTLGALGNVAQYQGRYEDALAVFQRSLAMNRASGNKTWEATNLTCLGNCSRALERLDDSKRYLEQAAALNREIGNKSGESFSLDGLGGVLLETGDAAGARRCFEQALAIVRELGDEHSEAVVLGSLARVAMREGDWAQARARFVEAMRLAQRLGAGLQVSLSLDGFAQLLIVELQCEQAVRLWAAADMIRSTAGVPSGDPDARQAEDMARARAVLGEQGFADVWGEGSRLTLNQAVEAALGHSSTTVR